MAFIPRPTETPDTLLLDLAQARVAALPFLRDLSPPLCNPRLKLYITEANWRLDASREWVPVALPHYGGPTGKARTWYQMEFQLDESHFKAGTLWLCFGGVDYKAAVFLNGQFVGTHEGFFSPFEFEITADATIGKNDLLVRVDNDAIHQGNSAWGDPSAGDKIYGATGLGWDEAGSGWHHCPPGMGVHRPISIESRPLLHVKDIFARPLILEQAVEIHAEIFNSGVVEKDFTVEIEVHPQNFDGAPVKISCNAFTPAGSGFNRYRIRVPLPEARLWSPDSPWLYQARILLNGEKHPDTLSRQFGMRSFLLDESPGPDGRRGRFLLNGQPVRLRGANTMGHEQQCVLRNDLDQLRDDILLAKLANMNFLRFTQRPVEAEVYDLCDRLGMMSQTDLPLFAYLRRNQFCEAVRQSSEMERLIRGHASAVLVSLINEPFPSEWGDKSHRHLTREELENFFVAATHAIHVENPDRQIKPIDGDYEPPGPGLPDGHCYSGWYNGHGLDLGKLHKGYWTRVKPGWNYACGEFGSEGLDGEDLMRARYPAAWLPNGPEDEAAWSPSRIHKAQTGSHHYLWMEEAEQMGTWVRRSQEHQAWITRLMTEAFRRDNRMVSFAIHLFIDAWPAGWMKTIMDCRRHPKPAYFAYRNALAPLAVNCRADRTCGTSGESIEVEAWICNDPNTIPDDIELCYQLEHQGCVVRSARIPAKIRANEAVFQGFIRFQLPAVAERDTITLRLGLLSASGETLHDTSQVIGVFPVPANPATCGTPRVLGGEKARLLASEVFLSPSTANSLWIIDNPESLDDPEMLNAVALGAAALVIELPPGAYRIAGSKIICEATDMEKRHFVSRATTHPVASMFREGDFKFWYDSKLDRAVPLLETLFYADSSWNPVLLTGQGGWGRSWEPALAAAEKPHGLGRFIICQITLAGRLINPVARLFAHRIICSTDHPKPHQEEHLPPPHLFQTQ